MANRIPGVFNFSANFETKIAAPLDARSTVVNQSELTDGSLPYPYVGMVVAVTSDSSSSNNGLYILKATPATILSNWEKLAESDSETGTTISSVELIGTQQIITLNNGDTFETDLNWLELAGNQFSAGVTNHSFQKIIKTDFTGTTISAITGETVYITDIEYGTELQPAKMNIIVIDLDDTLDENHFLVNMPTLINNEFGIIYKFIVKRNHLLALHKNLMIYSENTKIYSANVKTAYNNSYFLPLETLESAELIWDGNDFLVTNIVKQEYVGLNADNFINSDNSEYVIRDIDEL